MEQGRQVAFLFAKPNFPAIPLDMTGMRSWMRESGGFASVVRVAKVRSVSPSGDCQSDRFGSISLAGRRLDDRRAFAESVRTVCFVLPEYAHKPCTELHCAAEVHKIAKRQLPPARNLVVR